MRTTRRQHRKERGGRLSMFTMWTIDDWEAFVVLTRTILDQMREKGFEQLVQKVLSNLIKESDEVMQDDKLQHGTEEQEESNIETEQQTEQQTEREQSTPVVAMPTDMQVGFLMSTVFKHLTRIAKLFEILCGVYPDLRAELGPSLNDWINELNADVEAGFGFSIVEREESETI